MEDTSPTALILDIDEFAYYRRISRTQDDPDDSSNLKLLIESRLSLQVSHTLSPEGTWTYEDPPWERFFQGLRHRAWNTEPWYAQTQIAKARQARRDLTRQLEDRREEQNEELDPLVQIGNDYEAGGFYFISELGGQNTALVPCWLKALETLDKIRHFAPCWYRCSFGADNAFFRERQCCMVQAIHILCEESTELWNLNVLLFNRFGNQRFQLQTHECGCNRPNVDLPQQDSRFKCEIAAQEDSYKNFRVGGEHHIFEKFLLHSIRKGGYTRLTEADFPEFIE